VKTIGAVFALALGLGLAAGCESSSDAPSDATPQPSTTTPLGDNVTQLVIDFGPNQKGFANSLYASVTVCVPGTTQCQTIDHVVVDTGSVGLRIMGSALTLALPPLTNATGDSLAECAQFVSGYCWGPLRKADLRMANEVAANLTVQVIDKSSFPTPSSCTGEDVSSVEQLGANGILGIGPLAEDCGAACSLVPGSTSSNPELYFACSNATCSAAAVPVAEQIINPVTAFAQDNNGTIIELPTIPGHSSARVTGSLIFGIGTRDNNGLGAATVFAADRTGAVLTTYPVSGRSSSPAVLDSGSNGIYFSDPAVSHIAACTNAKYTNFYCPSQRIVQSALVFDSRGEHQTDVTFAVGNVEAMAQKPHSAFDDLAGPNSGADARAAGFSSYFDWGLPFYFGRRVFTAVEDRTTPGGVGPYFAF
jgi:hypothetical protein